VRLKTLLLFFILSLSAGCSMLWPKYEKPKINTPEKWSSKDLLAKADTQKISELAWWKQFHDRELDELMKCVLIKNNDLKVALGNIKQAQASLQKVQSAWIPSLTLGGTAVKGELTNFQIKNARKESLLGVFDNRSSWPYNGYSAGFVPSYTINLLSQTKQDLMAALQVQNSVEAMHAVRLTVISQTAASYFTLIGLKKQLYLQYQLLRDLEEIQKYTLIQYKQGAVSKMNVYSIDQYVADVKKSIPTIKNGITNAGNAINVLLDKNPGPVVTKYSFDQINTNGTLPVALPADVVRQRPDIAILEHQIEIYNAAIAATSAQFFPTTNLSAFWGPLGFTFVDFFAGANLLQGAISAGMPLLNMGIWADIKRAQAAKYSAIYDYIQSVRSAFSQVDDSLSKHYTSHESYEQQLRALSDTTAQYKLAKYQYDQGALSYASALLYKVNRDDSLAVLNKNKLEEINSIVSLYLALGGGAKANC
jgi:outer membrane protein, multidrug efflux system